MRSLDPLQQQQQHMGSPLPHPPVAQISGPHYRNQGVTLPHPSQYPDVTSDPTGQNIRYVRPVTDSRVTSASRYDKEVKRRVKTGCLTCRKRRVKCDEQHPACRNCQKSKRKCLGYDPISKAQPGLAAIQPAPSSAYSKDPLVATANPYGSQRHMFGAAHGALTVGYDPALSEGVSSPVSASKPFDYTSAIDPALAKRPINNLLSLGGATPSHPSLETTWVAISDDTMSGGYKYKQITEAGGIRLIVLQPALDASAMIQCSLVHTTVPLSRIGNDLNHYTALSYVWGSPEKSRTIYVDGAPLNITESLYLALHDLRDETRTLQLWADGICINQSDNEEKGIQIHMMGRIYVMAQHTIIYLGPADGNSPEILSLVAIQEGLTQSTGVQESILSKDWFTRVWVFQELVFSTDPWIQCGKLKVKWDKFYNALRKPPTETLLKGNGNSPNILHNHDTLLESETYKTISKMNRAWKIYHDQIKPNLYNGLEADYSYVYDGFIKDVPENAILELLQASRGKGVSDPRDMVFAHVGFATDITRKDFSIDYSQTCVQVYRNCARYIARTHGIAILFACIGEGGMSTAGLKGLPSWVPDWTMPVARPFPRIATRLIGPVLYPTWIQEGEILVFHLRDFDTVLSVSSELSVHQIPIETRQRISSRVKKLDNTFSPSQKCDIKELWYEVYQIWRQIVQDDTILPVELELMHRYHFEKEQDNPFNSYTAVQLLIILVFGTSTDAQCVNGRALARTASGKLALVPASTQKADIVAPIWIESDNFSHAPKYVFHPTADASSKAALNDEIVKCMDLQLLHLESWDETSEEYGIVSGKGWSIVHAEFVGECFLDRQESLAASESHNPMENFIVALH